MLIQEIVLDYVDQLRDEGKCWADTLSQVKPVLCKLGHIDSDALGSKTLEEYRRSRRRDETRYGTPPAHATINRELQALQAALRRAQSIELIETVPKFRFTPERGRRTDWCREEQLRRLLEYLRPRHPPVADLIEFCFHTGWRRQEVTELRWEEVDWEQGAILLDLSRTKERKARLFPIEGAVEEILKRRQAVKDGPWVFHRDGREIRCFKRAWVSARKAAGVPWLKIHGFRRTFATYQMLAGVPETVTMNLAGWTTRSTHERYKIVNQRALRDAVRRTSAYLESEGGASGKKRTSP